MFQLEKFSRKEPLEHYNNWRKTRIQLNIYATIFKPN